MQRFVNLGIVGEGSYGVVFKCLHKGTGQLVAIKKFIELDGDDDAKKIAKREIRMLKLLQHENIITLKEIFMEHKELHLVFEFMDHSLLDEMTAWTDRPNLNTCQRILWQVLKGLQFIHSRNVIHRDLKPENILVNNRGVVKICDLGFARTLAMPGEIYTDYVATRWYRAPELVIGDVKYGRAVDIWAIGCLLPEMLTGSPLFPGDSDINQLYLIMECLGNLTQRHKEVFRRNPLFIGMRLPQMYEIVPLEYKLSDIPASTQCLSFIEQCLQIDPARRPTCTDLMMHDLFLMDGFDKLYPLQLKQKVQVKRNSLADPQMRSSQNYNSNESFHPSNTRFETAGRLKKQVEWKDQRHNAIKLKGTSKTKITASNNRLQAECQHKLVSITSKNDANIQTLEVSSAGSGTDVVNQGTSNNNSTTLQSLTDYDCFDLDMNARHCPSSTQYPVTSRTLNLNIHAKNNPVKKVCRFSSVSHHHHFTAPSLHLKPTEKSFFCSSSMEKVQNIISDRLNEERPHISLPEVKITTGCESKSKKQMSCMKSSVTSIPHISHDEHFLPASLTQLTTTNSDKDIDMSVLPNL